MISMASDPSATDGGGANFGVEGSGGVCSICIESVATGGDRSIAQLFCGHVFHLDCIGSAFNVKGKMQCPNCRKVENGNWRFAKAGCSYLDANSHQSVDEDFDFALNVPLSLPWCPFGRPVHVPSSSEQLDSSSTREPESPSPSLHHAIPGFCHGIFPENIVICPYVAYLQSFDPSSASSHVSSGNPSNGTAFRSHQSCQRRSTEMHHSRNDHNQESTYHGWNHSYFLHGPPYSPSIDAGQASTHAPPLRIFRADDPFFQVRPHHGFDQSYGRSSGSYASSNVSTNTSNDVQERLYQYESWIRSNKSFFSGEHQSGNSRSVAPIRPSHYSSNDNEYLFFGHDSSIGETIHGLESFQGGSHHYAWDGAPCSYLPPFIVNERGIPQYSSSASGPTSGARQFWYQHDLERAQQGGRTDSSSSGQCTGPHIHHFI